MATFFGPNWALFSASALGIVSALAAKRLSIDFSKDINLESDPLAFDPPNLYMPDADDGPVTTAMEIEVASDSNGESREMNTRSGPRSGPCTSDRICLGPSVISEFSIGSLSKRQSRD